MRSSMRPRLRQSSAAGCSTSKPTTVCSVWLNATPIRWIGSPLARYLATPETAARYRTDRRPPRRSRCSRLNKRGPRRGPGPEAPARARHPGPPLSRLGLSCSSTRTTTRSQCRAWTGHSRPPTRPEKVSPTRSCTPSRSALTASSSRCCQPVARAMACRAAHAGAGWRAALQVCRSQQSVLSSQDPLRAIRDGLSDDVETSCPRARRGCSALRCRMRRRRLRRAALGRALPGATASP